MTATIHFLLPASDYDPTESGLPWRALRDAGVEVAFATPDGEPALADRRLTDDGFSLLSPWLIHRAIKQLEEELQLTGAGDE